MVPRRLLLPLVEPLNNENASTMEAEAVHKSLTGTKFKGLWCYNSLSFNLIYFLFSFPPCLFVCTHDFGCCLSSGGMYTCSSPTLVHLSALRCFSVVCHASVLSHLFFYCVHTGCLLLSVVHLYIYLLFVSPHRLI